MSGPTNSDNYSFAISSTTQETVSKIEVNVGAVVEAHENIDIRAKATDSNSSAASTTSYYDGRVGAVASLAFGSSDVLVTIDGTVRAGQGGLVSDVTFHPSHAINFTNSSLTFPAPHDFTTGDELRLFHEHR